MSPRLMAHSVLYRSKICLHVLVHITYFCIYFCLSMLPRRIYQEMIDPFAIDVYIMQFFISTGAVAFKINWLSSAQQIYTAQIRINADNFQLTHRVVAREIVYPLIFWPKHVNTGRPKKLLFIELNFSALSQFRQRVYMTAKEQANIRMWIRMWLICIREKACS